MPSLLRQDPEQEEQAALDTGSLVSSPQQPVEPQNSLVQQPEQPEVPQEEQPQELGQEQPKRYIPDSENQAGSPFEAKIGLKNKLLAPVNSLRPKHTEEQLRAYSDIRTPEPEETSGILRDLHLNSIYDMTVGPGLASLGVLNTKQGLTYDIEYMKNQWADSPVWLNVLNLTGLVATLFPLGAAVRGSLLKSSNLAEADMHFAMLKKAGMLDESIKTVKDMDPSHLNDLINSVEDHRRRIVMEDRLKEYKKLQKNPNDTSIEPFSGSEKVKLWFYKNFGNSFAKIQNDFSAEGPVRKEFTERFLAAIDKASMQDFTANLPPAERGTDFYHAIFAHQFPDRVPMPALTNSPEDQNMMALVERMVKKAKADHQERLDDGFVGPEEGDTVGNFHLNGLRKKQRNLGDATAVTGKVRFNPKTGEPIVYGMPSTDSPTLKTRNSSPEVLLDALERGELITDPASIVTSMFIEDTLVHQSFKTITSIAGDKRVAIPDADIRAAIKSKTINPADYVNLNDGELTPHRDRIARMMKVAGAETLGPDGQLPWVPVHVFQHMFGETGLLQQTQMAGQFGLLTAYTAGFKTGVTSLNPKSQITNITSAVPLLSQSGVNIFSPENHAAAKTIFGAVKKIAQYHKENGRDREALQTLFSGIIPKDFDLGTVTLKGKSLNLTEEMLRPDVLRMLEEGAFETTESYNGMRHMLAASKEGSMTRNFTKMMSGMKDASYKVGTTKYNLGEGMDMMSRTYLAGDMVPKMLSYSSLRSKGFSPEAAIYEVGKRFPMYGTAGAMIQSGRKVAFPWLSFPTEVLRITKNNMLDHPLRTLPWLLYPAITQTVLSELGLAPKTDELPEYAKGLPTYFQNPALVMAYGEKGGKEGMPSGVGMLAGMQGGLAGAAIGAAKGGALGAVVGGVAGAVTGYQTGKKAVDVVRGAVMDFLPHTSFFPTSTAKDINPTLPGESVLKSMLPFNPTPKYLIQSLQDQSPAKPFAILAPLLNLMMGEDVNGNPIQLADGGDYIKTIIASTAGQLLPPFIQQTMLNPTGPKLTMSEALGFPIPGDPTNVYKLWQEMGWKAGSSLRNLNAMTLREGSAPVEMFLRRLTGVLNSAPSLPVTRLQNEKRFDQGYASIQSDLTKQWQLQTLNQDDQAAADVLSRIYSNFVNMNKGNLDFAFSDLLNWQKEQASTLMKHPAFKGQSKQDIINKMMDANKYAHAANKDALNQYLRFLALKFEQDSSRPSTGRAPASGGGGASQQQPGDVQLQQVQTDQVQLEGAGPQQAQGQKVIDFGMGMTLDNSGF